MNIWHNINLLKYTPIIKNNIFKDVSIENDFNLEYEIDNHFLFLFQMIFL